MGVCVCVLGEKFVVLSRVVREGREGLTAKGIFVSRFKGGDIINHAETLKKGIL